MVSFDRQDCLIVFEFFKVNSNNKIVTNEIYELVGIEGNKKTGITTTINQDYGQHVLTLYEGDSYS